MDNIKQFPKTWQVYKTDFCTYVTDRKGKITNIFLFPDGQEINTEHLNVIIYDNGIEFLK